MENSEIEITGSISFEDLNKNRELAIQKLGANIKIDGFREGKVPEKILVEKYKADRDNLVYHILNSKTPKWGSLKIQLVKW